MKKYIILSVNDNPDYLYFTPLVIWAWKQFGWDTILMHQSDTVIPKNGIVSFGGQSCYCINISKQDGYRSDTITQVSRLYAACIQEGYLMTGDIDMIPLSDYWKPQEDTITVYGHDLTGYGHYPICYIGMPHTRWIEIMGLSSSDYNALIKRDLDTLPQAKNPDFYKYWFSDQDLITQRIQSTEFPITSILRGQYKNGFARGRVDRGSWTLDHPVFIDAHLHHQIYHRGNEHKFEATMQLLMNNWPNEDFTWFEEYHKEFKRLTGHD